MGRHHHHKVKPESESKPETDDGEPDPRTSCAVDLNWGAIPVACKPKVAVSSNTGTSVDIASMKMAAYVKARQTMKERVVKEVFEAAMPDVRLRVVTGLPSLFRGSST